MVKQGRRKATNAQEAAIATVANGSNSDGRAVSADTGCTQAAAAQRGRHYTISMAVPGSMIDNTQNLEFATFVASQVRSLSVCQQQVCCCWHATAAQGMSSHHPLIQPAADTIPCTLTTSHTYPGRPHCRHIWCRRAGGCG